jgi:hypothetical protein
VITPLRRGSIECRSACARRGARAIDALRADLEQLIAARDARLLKWMVALWIATLSATGVLKVVG